MKLRILGFFAICAVVGFSIIVQARVTNGQQLYVSAKAIEDYKTTIQTETEDKERIEQLIAETGKKLQEYEKLAGNEDNELNDKLLEEREYYKLISGETVVHGEGVVVYVDDGTRDLYEGEDPNAVLVHDIDILTIINELNRSGAEVLSVNGQRIRTIPPYPAPVIRSASTSNFLQDPLGSEPSEIEAVGGLARHPGRRVTD